MQSDCIDRVLKQPAALLTAADCLCLFTPLSHREDQNYTVYIPSAVFDWGRTIGDPILISISAMRVWFANPTPPLEP